MILLSKDYHQMTTILPLSVLKHINTFIAEPCFVYFDKIYGRLIKKNISTGIETVLNDTIFDIFNPESILNIKYNNDTYVINTYSKHVCSKSCLNCVCIDDHFKFKKKKAFLINNIWCLDSQIHYHRLYKNNHIENIIINYNQEITPPSTYPYNILIGFYFQYIIFKNDRQFLIYDNDYSQVIERIDIPNQREDLHSHYYDGFKFYGKKFFADNFVANINHNQHSINIYWVVDHSDWRGPSWSLIIMEKDKIKSYPFLSNFGVECPTFIFYNTIYIIRGYNIIISKLNGFELEHVKNLNIEVDYDKVFFSNNYLYFIDNTCIYSFDLLKETFTLIYNNSHNYCIVNIESDFNTLDFYIQEAIEYKELRYKNYIQKLI